MKEPADDLLAVADSNVEVDIALATVVDSLRQWYYVNAMPEPPPETVEEWVRLAEEPRSRTSRAIFAAYRSYGMLREHE